MTKKELRTELMARIATLLDSGDDLGCEDMFCVDADAFLDLRRAYHDLTGEWRGTVNNDYEENDEDD